MKYFYYHKCDLDNQKYVCFDCKKNINTKKDYLRKICDIHEKKENIKWRNWNVIGENNRLEENEKRLEGVFSRYYIQKQRNPYLERSGSSPIFI